MTRRSVALSALTFLVAGCAGLFFYPWTQHVRTPEQIGLVYEDVWFQTVDGVQLHGWFLPAEKEACATVLFLHGNAENVSTHLASVYWLPSRGFNVFMPDYRGYGASEGTPSLKGIQRDIDAAVRLLVGRTGEDAKAIVIFGQSLGGAAAIYYTAYSEYRDSIAALVAESTFASHRQIAREKMAQFWLTWALQWVPSLTVSDAYGPLAAVGKVAPIPLLLVHGDQDHIVPPVHGERLHAAAREPKELWRVEGGHIQAFRSERLRDRLVSFLSGYACPGRSVSSAAEQLRGGVRRRALRCDVSSR